MAHSMNTSIVNKGFNKARTYGFIGTGFSCLILFMCMWFYVMPFHQITPPVEEEGLLISFGNSDEGGGRGDELMGVPKENPKPEAVQKNNNTVYEPVKPTVSSPKTVTTNNDYITQKETSLAIAEKQKKEKQRQDQIAAENVRVEKERQIAEQKQREQAAINRANSSMKGLFGNSTSAGNGVGTGSGSGTGPGHQGNPVGKGYAGGHSWSLNGRSLTSMVQPKYDKNIEGKITVNIRVDENGHVTSTSIGSPTNISDADMIHAALSAAGRARFSAGSGIATGSITYNFNLK